LEHRLVSRVVDLIEDQAAVGVAFAVKTAKLDVSVDSSAAVVGFNLHFNTLAKAAIIGLYKR
jgi:hypothetical protein